VLLSRPLSDRQGALAFIVRIHAERTARRSPTRPGFASDAERSYKLTSIEARAVEAYAAARAMSGPRLKAKIDGKNAVRLEPTIPTRRSDSSP
jgi:hypothetical protein